MFTPPTEVFKMVIQLTDEKVGIFQHQLQVALEIKTSSLFH
jgi:hypothetical protein